MSITQKLTEIKNNIPDNIKLIAVSKTKPNEDILEAYNSGHRIFGENKVQELTRKYDELPKDIEWHMIGHMQSNKVKYIAPFVHLLHGIDSFKLLKVVNKEGQKNNRTINCLLQVYIAKEDTKFGLSYNEVVNILESDEYKSLTNINIVGLMGMASYTEDLNQIKREFSFLKSSFDKLKLDYFADNSNFKEISMGMSGDYIHAIDTGSTMVRIGSSIFGARSLRPI